MSIFATIYRSGIPAEIYYGDNSEEVYNTLIENGFLLENHEYVSSDSNITHITFHTTSGNTPFKVLTKHPMLNLSERLSYALPC